MTHIIITMPSQVNIYEMFVVYYSVFYTLYPSCCRSQLCVILLFVLYMHL